MSTPPRGNPPRDVLPDVLEAALRAEAELARRLLEAAPLPEGSTRDPAYFDLVTSYDRYMPSPEVTAIARLLYMLDAYGVTDAAAMDRLIEAHNERMAALAADTAYLTRMKIPIQRLRDAQFSEAARRNAVANVREHGRVALDATATGRLLVEFARQTQVDEAVRLLTALGLFERVEGDYNSKVRLSTGKLEAVYRGYLAHLAQGVGAALGGGDGEGREGWGDDEGGGGV